MIQRTWMRGLLTLTLAASLAACGNDSGGGTATLPAPSEAGKSSAAMALLKVPTKVQGGIKDLLPVDTVAVLYAPSPGDMIQKMQKIVSHFEPEMASEITMANLLSEDSPVGPIADLVDPKRPFAVAFKMPGERGPSPRDMLPIVPVTDVDAAKQRFLDKGMPTPPATSGGYIAMGPPAEETDGSLLDGLPSGDVVMRINLAALMGKFKGQIQEGFDDMGKAAGQMPGAEGMVSKLTDGLRNLVDGVERLDLVATTNGDRVALAAQVSAKSGSKLADQMASMPGVTQIASHLAPDAPVSMVMNVPMASLGESITTMMREMASEMGSEEADIDAWASSYSEMMKHMDGAMAMSMFVGPERLRLVGLTESDDPAAAIAAMLKAYEGGAMRMAEQMGSKPEVMGTSTIAGVEVTSVRVGLDFDKLMAAQGQEMPPEAAAKFEEAMTRMLGEEGIAFHMAPVGKYLVQAMGDKAHVADAINLARQGGGASGTLGRAMDLAGDKPIFAIAFDIGTLLDDVLPLVKSLVPEKARDEVPPPPNVGKVPVVMHGGVTGRTFTLGMEADVAGIGRLVKKFTR